MNNIIKFLEGRIRFLSYSIMKVTSMILGLIANILIVRQLSVEDFGVFSIALMLIGLFTTLGFSWSSSSILYYGSKEIELRGKMNKTFWSRNIIISFSLLIVTIFFIIFRDHINTYIGMDVWILLLIWLYVSVIEDYLIQYFLAVKKQLLSSVISITAKIFYILLITFVTLDVITLIKIYILSHSVVILFALKINWKSIGKFEYDHSWFKEVLNFSLWQLFGFSGLYLINFGDVAVIKYFMSEHDVGIYNGAYQLFNAVASFSFVISSYFAPSISGYFIKKDKVSIKHFFYRERFYIILLSIIAHIFVIIFSEHIIVTLYGEVYKDSVYIFKILMLGSLLRYASVFYTIYYNTNKKHKILQFINILRAILNIVLSILFIQILGLIGTAIATTLAIFLTFLFSVFYCEKRIKRQI